MRPQDELEAAWKLARDGYYIEGDGGVLIPEWVFGEDGALSEIRVLSEPQTKRTPKPKQQRARRKAKAARQARRANR